MKGRFVVNLCAGSPCPADLGCPGTYFQRLPARFECVARCPVVAIARKGLGGLRLIVCGGG